MIKIKTLDLIDNIEHVVIPTIFPDNTSQCWKLPKELFESRNLKFTWNFEAEQEFLYLASLKNLLTNGRTNFHLHIPYLPYARQDKTIKNNATFNLITFSNLLNSLKFNLVTAVDVHNPTRTEELIENFRNIEVENIITNCFDHYKISGLIFPDEGASTRYKINLNGIVCDKTRNQETGEITGHKIFYCKNSDIDIKKAKQFLIVDDICDYGRTFISVAKLFKEQNPNLIIDLYVTHGLFSGGRQILYDSGINKIYTTNSLLKNEEGFKV